MQTVKILQAAVLIVTAAIAGGCSAGKLYSSKLFAPRTPDSSIVAGTPRFLLMNELETDSTGWVSTDLISGRDTSASLQALDLLAEKLPILPASTAKPDTVSPVTLVKKISITDSNMQSKKELAGNTREKKMRAD